MRVVARYKWTTDVNMLLEHIQEVGQRLQEAQPKELVVGNIVRRVLGLIRDELKEERHEDVSDSGSNSKGGSPRRDTNGNKEHISMSPLRQNELLSADLPGLNEDGTIQASNRQTLQESQPRPALITSHTSYAVLTGLPAQQSMFNLLSATVSPLETPPGNQNVQMNAKQLTQRINTSTLDLKAEIINGIEEIIDELMQVDEQIAAYALDHIHSNEIILTHSSSRTVQTFLLKAAEKRKFTVIHVESYPNDHEETHATVMGSVQGDIDGGDEMSSDAFQKPLTKAGVTVILITDAAVFALMSRVNKVILATHVVIANGGLVAAAGARIIAKAAHKHRTPVIVLSGVYKLSPEYPYEVESLIEYGDTGKIINYEDGDLVEKLDVDNPLFDYVPPELVDLYITNL